MYKKLLIKFSRVGLRYFGNWLKPLKEEIVKSDLNMVFDTFVGKMFLFSFLSFILICIYISFLFVFIFGFNVLLSIISSIIIGVLGFVVVLTLFHSYPMQILNSKRRSIETNLPFAINHADAIASSGAPPNVIFKLLGHVKEYGEITRVSKKITRNAEVFGMDIVSAIKDVASRSPSEDMKKFLYGIVSSIETGGDLKKYLSNEAKEALRNYELKREKFLTTLSTYADFYTAVLIAAPLFFVSILSVMSMIGGQIFGMDIASAMRLGIYGLIPMLNIGFIAFVHYTQPNI
jgi:flagellar protein FlaJ